VSGDWRIYLTWDGGIRGPGYEWTMGEGKRLGEGYELHWLPGQLAVQLVRGGSQPTLLAAVRLDGPPREIEWKRRGMRVQVIVDGALRIDCLDPAAPPPARWWAFSTTAPRDECELSLHVDRTRDDPLALPVDGDIAGQFARLQSDPPTHGRSEGWRWAIDAVLGGDHDDPRRGDQLRLAAALVRDAVRSNPEDVNRKFAIIGLARSVLDQRQAWAGGDDGAAWQRSRLRRWLALAAVQAVMSSSSARLSDEELQALQEDLAASTPRQLPASVRDGELAAAERARTAVAGLVAACGREDLGLLLSLVDPLIERAARKPQVPVELRRLCDPPASGAADSRAAAANRAVLAAALAESSSPLAIGRRRAVWLDTARQVLEKIRAITDGGLTDDQRAMIDVAAHGTRCLIGQPPMPTPTDAADWLTVRWRLLAGSDPLRQILSPLPESVARTTVAVSVGRLLAIAAAEPLRAAGWTARLRDVDARGADLLPALLAAVGPGQDDPLPEPGSDLDADLIRGLIVLRSHQAILAETDPARRIAASVALAKERKTALDALTRAGTTPWQASDPLAYAVVSLIRVRMPEGDDTSQRDFLAPQRSGETERRLGSLANYENLLRGFAGDERLDSPLPPGRALLTVLCMQESVPAAAKPADKRAVPDWSLLDAVPSRSLPLEFARPMQSTAAGEGPALLP
jgi:hypothetical protein